MLRLNFIIIQFLILLCIQLVRTIGIHSKVRVNSAPPTKMSAQNVMSLRSSSFCIQNSINFIFRPKNDFNIQNEFRLKTFLYFEELNKAISY